MYLPLGGWLFPDRGALLSLLGGLEFWRAGEEYLGLRGGKFRCVGFIIPLYYMRNRLKWFDRHFKRLGYFALAIRRGDMV